MSRLQSCLGPLHQHRNVKDLHVLCVRIQCRSTFFSPNQVQSTKAPKSKLPASSRVDSGIAAKVMRAKRTGLGRFQRRKCLKKVVQRFESRFVEEATQVHLEESLHPWPETKRDPCFKPMTVLLRMAILTFISSKALQLPSQRFTTFRPWPASWFIR